jgi:hypothetical protein
MMTATTERAMEVLRYPRKVRSSAAEGKNSQNIIEI